MVPLLTAEQLIAEGLDESEAVSLAHRIAELAEAKGPAEAWQLMVDELIEPSHPFALHQLLFDTVMAGWDQRQGPPPAWWPKPSATGATHIAALMEELAIGEVQDLHRWSVTHREAFWERMIGRLAIQFDRPPHAVLDLAAGPEHPRWLVSARLNIVDSCFQSAPTAPAIVYQSETGDRGQLTTAELESLTNRVAQGLASLGLQPGDGVAICMPMTAPSVAIYLGLIRAGCVVVSIADSFAPEEIAKRLQIADAKAIFTQDVMVRAGKTHPLYARVKEAQAPQAIVLPAAGELSETLRSRDLAWVDFLGASDRFTSLQCDPEDLTNILFSSGTTGDPKAIPWTQLTPIKCAADGHLHHDIHPGDVIAWPTNIGWMMGPWLIYAALINGATIALFDGAPTGRPFGRFVEQAAVTMLGVVPSLVRAWKETGCMAGLDWTAIRAFSSTGECSSPDEMLYLMSLAGYRPIIEYCGGTEIGGGYLCGTVVQSASPATFTTPAFGLDIAIVDDQGQPASDGEVFVIGPSIGLSAELLNRDHHEVYFEDTPTGPQGELLRRHGDQIERLPGGYYRAHGRVDDTMNLGGIKTSSAEIERVLGLVAGVRETAAIAVALPGGGISRLVIFVVPEAGVEPEPAALQRELQKRLKTDLNPQFRIHDLQLVDSLPRTASNKVMRRQLRAAYRSGRWRTPG